MDGKKTYVVLPLSYQKIDCQSLALNINSFVQHMYGNDKQSGKEFKKNAHHIQKIQEKRDKALQSLNKAKLKYKSGDPKLAVAQKKFDALNLEYRMKCRNLQNEIENIVAKNIRALQINQKKEGDQPILPGRIADESRKDTIAANGIQRGDGFVMDDATRESINALFQSQLVPESIRQQYASLLSLERSSVPLERELDDVHQLLMSVVNDMEGSESTMPKVREEVETAKTILLTSQQLSPIARKQSLLSAGAILLLASREAMKASDVPDSRVFAIPKGKTMDRIIQGVVSHSPTLSPHDLQTLASTGNQKPNGELTKKAEEIAAAVRRGSQEMSQEIQAAQENAEVGGLDRMGITPLIITLLAAGVTRQYSLIYAFCLSHVVKNQSLITRSLVWTGGLLTGLVGTPSIMIGSQLGIKSFEVAPLLLANLMTQAPPVGIAALLAIHFLGVSDDIDAFTISIGRNKPPESIERNESLEDV